MMLFFSSSFLHLSSPFPRMTARPNSQPALLVLADGRSFPGYAVGVPGETMGELCFNTSMTGYEAILTDPSYAGQIITFTTPHVGNYGLNRADWEGNGPAACGVVLRALSTAPSNWRSDQSLPAFFQDHDLVAIAGVDTRALTRHLRRQGAMNGIISTVDLDPESLFRKVRTHPSLTGRDLAQTVTCRKAWEYAEPARAGKTVAILDFGVKHSILKRLQERHCHLRIVPGTTEAEEILGLKPDGVLFSNGPGDPAAVTYGITTARRLWGQVPLLGICLGHQLLNLAAGARTYKLKFGHRGGNHPVQNLKTGRIDMTSQNHGFAVAEDSLPANVDLTHRNLNDGTVEGTAWRDVPVFSLQYHPEGGPGPHDAYDAFASFLTLMDTFHAETN